MSDPNRLGNGNSGDSENNRARSFEINWDDILKSAREFDALRSRGNGDLLDDASDNNVEPLKSSKVNTGDDFEEVDLSSAGNKTTSYSERLSALLGYDNTGRNNPNGVPVTGQPKNPNGAPVTGQPKNPNGAPVTGQPNNPNGVPVTGQPNNPNGVPVTGQPNNPNGVPVTGQPNNPNGVPVTGQPKNPNVLGTKGNKVRGIMERFRKSGIGKLFVGACIVTALTGAFGMTYQNGYKNGAANATAKIESQVNVNTNENQGGETGSDGATKELDETATDSNAEEDNEKIDKSVDVKTADGRVIEGVNFELGGDNSGADMIDRSLMESSHFGALTTKPAEWLNGGEGAEYRAAEGDADAMDSLLKKSLEEFNSHAGNPAVLVQEAYSLGYVDKAQMSLEQKGADTMAIMKDNAKYNDMKSFVEQKKIELEKKMGHGLMLLTDGQHYVSPYIRAVDAQGNLAKSVSEIDSVSHHVDKSVNPYEGGVLVITDVVQGTNLNYYEANPEAKEMGLRDIGLIAPDASEAQIKEAMKKYILLGHEAGCKQLIAVEVTPEDTSTYKVEYKTPEDSSSTYTDISIAPIYPDKPDPKLDDGSGIHKEEDDSSKKKIRRITRGGNNHDDSSIHEDDKKKGDDTPDKTPDKPSETPDKPSETPDKPSETPKDNEKVLEAKTDIVHVSREDNLQKDVTVSNQTDNVLLDHVTESMPENVSGDEVVDNTAAGNAAVDLYEATNENGAVDNDKSISTASGAENLNTGATEKQSDAEGVNKVEEVKESVEKVPDTSYDLGYASAEWDFSNFGN